MRHLRPFLYLCFGCFFLLLSCKKDKVTNHPTSYDTAKAYTLKNISYGSDNNQIMDIYLPKDRRSDSTKVIVLIHGGSWTEGSKDDMATYFANLAALFPHDAVININYRLGVPSNPGYPKQIEDIKKALQFMQSPQFNVGDSYFFIGVSAGAHLSLLYGYKYDTLHQVKGICNTVGPTDFTDSSYTNYPLTQTLIQNFVGPYSYQQKPALYQATSPVYYITSSAPKTISFYGNQDPLVPLSQLDLLNEKLDSVGVIHESTIYNGGHANWSQADFSDYGMKVAQFITNYFQ